MILVSSDCNKVLKIAKQYNFYHGYKRPKYLSSNKANIIDAAFHAINWIEKNKECEIENVVLLQPTSPLRTSADIDSALEFMRSKKAAALISVVKSEKPPEWTINLDNDFKITNNLENLNKGKRRQDYPDSYNFNGAIYISEF